MVEEAKRTIAYLCPECRQAVVAEKTVSTRFQKQF